MEKLDYPKDAGVEEQFTATAHVKNNQAELALVNLRLHGDENCKVSFPDEERIVFARQALPVDRHISLDKCRPQRRNHQLSNARRTCFDMETLRLRCTTAGLSSSAKRVRLTHC